MLLFWSSFLFTTYDTFTNEGLPSHLKGCANYPSLYFYQIFYRWTWMLRLLPPPPMINNAEKKRYEVICTKLLVHISTSSLGETLNVCTQHTAKGPAQGGTRFPPDVHST